MAISINSINGNPYVVLAAPIAADATQSGGSFVIGDSITGYRASIPITNMVSRARQVSVAGVLQVQVLTPTAVNSHLYLLPITQIVGGVAYSHTYQYQADASATRLEIVVGLSAAINADTRILITPSTTGGGGSETLTLTAQDPSYTFTTVSTTSLSAAAPSTAGVYAVGTGTVLQTQGYDDASTSLTYTRYTYVYLLGGVETVFEVLAYDLYATYAVFDAAAQANGNATTTRGSVTQITSITEGVTLNTQIGAITTFAYTTAASTLGGDIIVTNSYCNAGSFPLLTVELGTCTQGQPIAQVVSVAAGSFTIRVSNGKIGTEALNGTLVLYYSLV